MDKEEVIPPSQKKKGRWRGSDLSARQRDFESIPPDGVPIPRNRRVDLLAKITQGAAICAAATLNTGKFTVSVNIHSPQSIAFIRKIFTNLSLVACLAAELENLLNHSIFYLNPTEDSDFILAELENGKGALVVKNNILYYLCKNSKGKTFKNQLPISEEHIRLILKIIKKIEPEKRNVHLKKVLSQEEYSEIKEIVDFAFLSKKPAKSSTFYLNPPQSVEEILQTLEDGTDACVLIGNRFTYMGKSALSPITLSKEYDLDSSKVIKILDLVEINSNIIFSRTLSQMEFLFLLQNLLSIDLLDEFRQKIKKPFDHLKDQLKDQKVIIPSPDENPTMPFIYADIAVRLSKIINSIIDTYLLPDCATSFGRLTQPIFLSVDNIDYIDSATASSSTKGKEGSMDESNQDVHAELKIIDDLFNNDKIASDDQPPYYIGISKPCCPLCKCAIDAVNEAYGERIMTRQSEHAQINPAGIPEFLKTDEKVRNIFLTRFLEHADNAQRMFTLDDTQEYSFRQIVEKYPLTALKLIFSAGLPIQTKSLSRVSASPVDFLSNIQSIERNVTLFTKEVISGPDTVNAKKTPDFDRISKRRFSLNQITHSETRQEPRHTRKLSAPF